MNPSTAAAGTRETRIALAFYGGVALAVYECGVAYEIHRLVRGEGAWKRLRDRIGPVLVDVISGTSAGGMNGVFLANALVGRGDMGRLLTLWHDAADLDALLRAPGTDEPPSVLDGDWFLDQIHQAMTAARPGAGLEAPTTPELDLFVTATSLDGERIAIDTPDGDRIQTRTHRQVFRFRYADAAHAPDRRAVNDFATDEDLTLLARAARATASFPMAFEPTLVRRAGLGRRAQRFEADGFHIDGGVLDNKPIALAMRALAERRDHANVDRLLLYVEPDPEVVGARLSDGEARPYEPLAVVMKALFELPQYQSVTEALESISRHNEDVDERLGTLRHFERAAADSVAEKPKSGFERTPEHWDRKFVAPGERASAVFRALEDGYLDLRLRDVEEPLAAELRGPQRRRRNGEGLLARSFRNLAMAVRDALRPAGKVEAEELEALASARTRAAELVYAAKRLVVDYHDARYSARLYEYLVAYLRTLYPQERTGTGGPETAFLAGSRAELDGLVTFLRDQEATVRRRFETEAAAQGTALLSVRSAVDAAVGEIRLLAERRRHDKSRREVPADPAAEEFAAQDAAELLGADLGRVDKALKDLVDKVAAESLAQQRTKWFDTLRDALWSEAKRIRGRLLGTLEKGPGGPVAAALLRRVRRGFGGFADAQHGFYLRDMLLRPTLLADPEAPPLARIRFARISPADASGDEGATSAAQKLAGEGFAHFGGFLKREWRGNDLTWGRLDASEILLRHLAAGVPEGERAAIARDLRREIKDDMRTRGMTIARPVPHADGSPFPWGAETLADVDRWKKRRWFFASAVLVSKIVRKPLRRFEGLPWIGPLVGRCFQVVELGFRGVHALVPTWRWCAETKWLRTLLAIVVLAAVAIALWERSLREWLEALLDAFR